MGRRTLIAALFLLLVCTNPAQCRPPRVSLAIKRGKEPHDEATNAAVGLIRRWWLAAPPGRRHPTRLSRWAVPPRWQDVSAVVSDPSGMGAGW